MADGGHPTRLAGVANERAHEYARMLFAIP